MVENCGGCAMGRICFVSLDNLYLLPYFRRYLPYVKEFDVVFCNRSNIEEKNMAKNSYVFRFPSKNKYQKLLGYLLFSRFAAKVLKKNNYDRVILLHTQLAVLLQELLCDRYAGRYLLDIRDYSYEKLRWFYRREQKLVANAGLNVVSSKGFLSFLPPGNYIPVHNDNVIEQDYIKAARACFSIDRRPIVISNIGLIRFHQQNKKLILAFRNDPRFEIRFIGQGAGELAEFCREQKVENVHLTDYFPPEQTLEHFMRSDVIFNLYGNHTPLLDFALSNKLYFAAKFCRPILVCPDTYMEKVSKGFGYTMDLDAPHIADDFYSYYSTIEKDKMLKACDEFLEEVLKENEIFNRQVETFLR